MTAQKSQRDVSLTYGAASGLFITNRENSEAYVNRRIDNMPETITWKKKLMFNVFLRSLKSLLLCDIERNLTNEIVIPNPVNVNKSFPGVRDRFNKP